jgi:hypothetical protein
VERLEVGAGSVMSFICLLRRGVDHHAGASAATHLRTECSAHSRGEGLHTCQQCCTSLWSTQ